MHENVQQNLVSEKDQYCLVRVNLLLHFAKAEDIKAVRSQERTFSTNFTKKSWSDALQTSIGSKGEVSLRCMGQQ